MGAPVIIGDSYNLWITNNMKDAFCEVLTSVATLEGNDMMAIYEEAPASLGHTVSPVWVSISTSFIAISADSQASGATSTYAESGCTR